jgi:hypothetical protein
MALSTWIMGALKVKWSSSMLKSMSFSFAIKPGWLWIYRPKVKNNTWHVQAGHDDTCLKSQLLKVVAREPRVQGQPGVHNKNLTHTST